MNVKIFSTSAALYFSVFLVPAQPAAPHCENFKKHISSQFQVEKSHHETIDSDFRARVFESYRKMKKKNPRAFERMKNALEKRFANGCVVGLSIPRPGVTVFTIFSSKGDKVVRIFAPVVNWRWEGEDNQKNMTVLFKIITAATDTNITETKESFFDKAWKSKGFQKLNNTLGRQVYVVGIPPDLIDVSYSSQSEQSCKFLSVSGWIARQICADAEAADPISESDHD